MSKDVMDFFWDMAALDDTARLAAIAKLIRHLVAGQGEEPGLNAELVYCVEVGASGPL